MPLTRKEYGLTYLTWPGRVLLTLVVLLALFLAIFGIAYLIHKSDEEYRHKCEAAGGRVVQVHSSGNICVEKETNRLLWV